MRAMILAAGLGTRMRPLTDERAKPALPVRGRPVISLLLELLARQGVREVLINLHHLPDTIRRAVEADHPPELEIAWSSEEKPLGTGGGIRRAAEFLRQSETCVVLAGDMLLDLDLRALESRHIAGGRGVSLVLRSDARESSFGSIGIDAAGRVCRIGRHPVAGTGPEAGRGLFTSVRFFDREVLCDWPANEVFEDLRDWLMPRAARNAIALGGEIVDASDSVWEPVGTPQEYLDVNLHPPDLPRLGGDASRWQGAVELSGRSQDVVAARTVRLPADAELSRCVVWEGASVPGGTKACGGVFGVRGFHGFDPSARVGSDSDVDRRGAA